MEFEQNWASIILVLLTLLGLFISLIWEQNSILQQQEH